jgi:hypothetical protein
VISSLGTTGDKSGVSIVALRCGDRGLSPIHSTYYDYYFFYQPAIERARL